MRMGTQLKYRDIALMQLRNLYFGAVEYDSKTLFEEKNSVFAFLREKKVPLYMINYIRGYDHCLYDMFMKERVLFLYCVNDKLYKLKESVEIDLPIWYTLPHDVWDKLGELGGFYYKNSLKKYS